MLGKYTFVNFSQFEKAKDSTFVTPSGITKFTIAFLANALDSIVFSFPLLLNSSSDILHELNALVSINSTFSGIIILPARLLHPLNAFTSIFVTVSGILIVVRAVKLANAPDDIDVMSPLNSTLVIFDFELPNTTFGVALVLTM